MIRSHESVLLQLADFLIGAIAYKKRQDINHQSEIKNKIVEYIEMKLGKLVILNTAKGESKFNIFHHQAGYGR